MKFIFKFNLFALAFYLTNNCLVYNVGIIIIHQQVFFYITNVCTAVTDECCICLSFATQAFMSINVCTESFFYTLGTQNSSIELKINYMFFCFCYSSFFMSSLVLIVQTNAIHVPIFSVKTANMDTETTQTMVEEEEPLLSNLDIFLFSLIIGLIIYWFMSRKKSEPIPEFKKLETVA